MLHVTLPLSLITYKVIGFRNFIKLFDMHGDCYVCKLYMYTL